MVWAPIPPPTQCSPTETKSRVCLAAKLKDWDRLDRCDLSYNRWDQNQIPRSVLIEQTEVHFDPQCQRLNLDLEEQVPKLDKCSKLNCYGRTGGQFQWSELDDTQTDQKVKRWRRSTRYERLGRDAFDDFEERGHFRDRTISTGHFPVESRLLSTRNQINRFEWKGKRARSWRDITKLQMIGAIMTDRGSIGQVGTRSGTHDLFGDWSAGCL